ncbi:MAG: hypothetical protein ACRDHZ_07970 [Ktedonobacteraceae bacterium]
MKQTLLLKLRPTPEQHQALLDTMHAFNAACNFVAKVAFAEKTANKFELQKLVYGELRTTYKLAAQLAIRAISKASEAYKRDKSIQPTFRSDGAIVYDERVMSFKGLLTVSLLTINKRVLVPLISKRLVQKAKATGKAIALEELRHIRQRTEARLRYSQRAKHSKWSFSSGNSVFPSPIRLRFLVSLCIWLTLATHLERVQRAATVPKRTARVRPSSVVSIAV